MSNGEEALSPMLTTKQRSSKVPSNKASLNPKTQNNWNKATGNSNNYMASNESTKNFRSTYSRDQETSNGRSGQRKANESPNKGSQNRARGQIIIVANDGLELRRRQRFSESTSPMKNQRSFVLDSNSNYSSLSTSIGSELHGRQSQMLPRDHNLSVDQLISKVHRDM